MTAAEGPERPPGDLPGGARPRRFVSLLDGDDKAPPARDQARSSALDGSEHSSFRDLRPPEESFDLPASVAVCARITRDLMGDFAPGLVLLAPAERRRVQALVAWTRTLMDFTSDRSLEGERLSQINRWQFALEQALDGDPPGQPIFVVLAEEERRRPWPRDAFDELAAIARTRISEGRPRRIEGADAAYRRLGAAFFWALCGERCPARVSSLSAGVIRAHSLKGWRDRLAFDRPDLQIGTRDDDPISFPDAVLGEAAAIEALLAGASQSEVLAKPYHRLGHFTLGTALAITSRARSRIDRTEPPAIPLITRLRLIASTLPPRRAYRRALAKEGDHR
jgi:hypothetical protein